MDNSKLVERIILLQEAEKDPKKQVAHLELCKRDPVYWFNTFCWTYDPRKKCPDIPFELYPFQEFVVREIIQAIRDGVDLCIEKSRDLGLSWLVICCFQYLWLFERGSNFHVGSRKEDEVDRGYIDPDQTIFGKFRYNLQRLPRWMKPEDWEATSRVRHLENSTNGNTITGEAPTSNFGRGARKKAMLLDEFAQWEFAVSAHESCAQTTPCRIVNGTPYGESNEYAKILNDKDNELRVYKPGEEWQPSIERRRRKLSLHWTLHPEKDQEWYEFQKSRMSPDAVARELDINYSMSASGVVFSAFNPSMHVTREYPKLDKRRPIFVIWDFGRTNVCLYLYRDEMRRVSAIHERILTGVTTAEQIDVALMDVAEHFQGHELIHVCDPAGAKNDHHIEKDADSIHKAFGRYPFFEIIDSYPTRDRKVEGRKQIENALQRMPGGKPFFQIYEAEGGVAGCPKLREAFASGYRYKVDKNGNVLDRIHEAHPFEDVIDCVIYYFLEVGEDDYASDVDFTPIISHSGYGY